MATMTFTPEKLQEHDDFVRKQLRLEFIQLADNYAEGCKLQAITQGADSSQEYLRGSVGACQFLASVMAMQN